MLKENIIKFFNRIFRQNRIPMISNVSNQNYQEYKKTYDTLSRIFGNLDGINAYLVGGISAAIQVNQDLYRQNGDIDIMCKEEDLPKLIKTLQKSGYIIDDRRGIKTRNSVNSEGHFQAMDHELNADTKNKKILGVGIFTYQVRGNEVITRSYAYEEKEGKVVGTEKVIPKELFDLMYNNTTIDYKGVKLKSQSKEYIFMVKSKGTREKDILDASIIEPTLDDVAKAKIQKIKELDAITRTYRIIYDKDGKILARTKLPTLEEKVFDYLDNLFMQDTTRNSEEVVEYVFQSEEYKRIISSHPEINSLIGKWKEKSKNYTYQDKIDLLTKKYSRHLETYSTETINNALSFLQKRRQNHGRDNDDIEISYEVKEIFSMMKEYGEAIKKVFIDNNIDITHITSVSPEKMEKRRIRKSIDRANNYETERVDGVFASSSPINGNNPYIARNSSGMIRIGESTYIYGEDNIDVESDEEGKKRAILKNPNYIYYINLEKFTPVCNLTINPYTHKPIFEFSEEWISKEEINISNPNQVRKIEEVRDVTNLLEHFTVLCDVNSKGIGLKAIQTKNKQQIIEIVSESIKNGSLRNINKETGINDKEIFEGQDR